MGRRLNALSNVTRQSESYPMRSPRKTRYLIGHRSIPAELKQALRLFGPDEWKWIAFAVLIGPLGQLLGMVSAQVFVQGHAVSPYFVDAHGNLTCANIYTTVMLRCIAFLHDSVQTMGP